MNYVGNAVTYVLDVAAAGDYNVTLSAANGRDAFDMNLLLNVNGADSVVPMTIATTAVTDNTWYNFVDMAPFTVTLKEGLNTLTLTCEVKNAFPNLYSLTVAPVAQAATTTANDETAEKIMLIDVYNDPELMDAFLDQLTIEELAELLSAQGNRDGGNTQGWGNNMDYGIPHVMTADGPQGIRIGYNCTAWPISTNLSCSWDVDVVAAVGKAAATEAHYHNMDIWLAPGMNIHRDPLCGRNFEYYSEDPLLTGKLAASITKAVQAEGVAISLKHFAANNKEQNRSSSDSRMTERALREIYLRGFEIAVKEADPWTIMSSYNFINGIETAENWDLITGILRTEWGYNGVVETDWGNNSNHVYEVLAGNDIKMTNSQPEQLVAAVESGKLTREHLEAGAERVLNLIMKVNYFQDKIVNVPIVQIGDDTNFKAAENIIWSATARGEDTSDTDGGSNLGYCDAGAWTQYEINVVKGGNYTLQARIASTAGNGGFDVIVDDVTIAHFECPNTGGYQKWITIQTEAATTVALTEGRHTLKLQWTESGSNLNWIQFTREQVHVTGITLDTIYSKLNIGDTLALNATVNPANADDVSVTWSSDNEAVATVDENGVVTAVAGGSAVITATTTDGEFTASCTIIVKGIGLDLSALEKAIADAEAAAKAAETAKQAAQDAADSAANDKTNADNALKAAEKAAAEADAAAKAAEDAKAAAEDAKKAAEENNAEAAEKAAQAFEEATKAATSASVAASAASTAAVAAASAQNAQLAAETAQTKAEAAQKAAEDAAATAANDKTAAQAAAGAAELAQKAAETAKAQAETAKSAAVAAAEAADESNVEAAEEASAAAKAATDSAASAEAAAASATASAEAAKAAQAAQKVAEDAAAQAAADKAAAEKAKEDAAKAAAEAAVNLAKYVALTDLVEKTEELTADTTAEQVDELVAVSEAARDAIKAAETEEAVAEIIAAAVAEMEAITEILCAGEEFTDVDVNEWYHDAIDFVINEGMMSGNGDGTFAPEAELSRAMLAQILYNIEGKPEVETDKSFSDVTEDDWYYDAVMWAAENGIVLGNDDGTYAPNDNITREQMVTMLWRYAGKPEAADAEITFADADAIDEYAQLAVAWAVENEIVKGVGDNRFNPDGNSKRSEAAQVMMNYFKK